MDMQVLPKQNKHRDKTLGSRVGNTSAGLSNGPPILSYPILAFQSHTPIQ